MNKKFKFLAVGFLALALVVGVGAYQANASLTLADLAITSSGALTLTGSTDSSVAIGAVTTGTTLTSFLFAPKGSATTSAISYHELMRVASTFGDPLHRTYGLSSEFTRSAVVSASFDGTDTGFVSKVNNTAVNTQAYNMQGAYIKAKNTGTVTGIKALDLEVQAGTSTNAYGITLHGTGTFTDLQLQDTSTIGAGVVDGTHLSSIVLTPKVLTAGSSTVNELVKIIGTGAFADVGAYTYGIQASFDRAVATTSDIGGFDTGLDLRVTNGTDVSNNAAYDLQGAYIKVRNKSGGVVDVMRGIDLEIANEGTTASAIGLNVHGAGNFADIHLQNGAIIAGGAATDDASITAQVDDAAVNGLYLATDGKVWILQSGTWTQLTVN